MSVHNLPNAFDSLPWSFGSHGILGCLLPDTLHCLSKGPAERMMELTINNLTNRQKAKLDDLAKHYHKTHNQTACKYYPSTDFSRGISQLTRLTANEHIGALFMLVIVSHYADGWKILQAAMNNQSDTVSVKDMIEFMEALLCFRAWLKLEQLWPLDKQDEYASYAHSSIQQLMHMLTTKMPREDGNSWKTIKLHLLLHYIEEAKRFGAPRNWDSERPEHFHIHTAKTHGRRANKCRETFKWSTAQRLADSFIIE